MSGHSVFTIITFARISIRRYFRDKVALFFTIAFPLIFLAIFGGLSNGGSVNFKVAILNQSDTQFSKTLAAELAKQKELKVSPGVNTLSQASQKMSRSEIDASIILPPGFGQLKNNVPSGQVQVLYDKNNEQAAQTLASVLEGNLQRYNSKYVKIVPPLGVVAKSTNKKGLSKFDYTFSGLLGFSILSLGIFGPLNYFPEMKKQGILRRLHITPLRTWEYFVSSVISNAVIGLISIAIMFIFAGSLFHFHMVGNYLELAGMVVLGVLTMFGIGLAIGGWAKNERQAAPVGNIIVMPMMFLSGTFFPRFLMPEWLQHITNYIPLTPIIDGIRLVATEGKHLTDLGAQLGLIGIWVIVIYFIAFRVFRWE